MIIKKRRLKTYLLLFFIFFIFIVFTLAQGLSQEKVTHHFLISSDWTELATGTLGSIDIASSNLDLPLPRPAKLSTTEGNIRLDLERISAEKFFIIYSVLYGDQSHTAYKLFLTDLERQNIAPEKIGEIWLETQEGEKIKPIAPQPTIRDFPSDQPLGWKIRVVAKFPYQTTRKNHKLVLNYDQQDFVIDNIKY